MIIADYEILDRIGTTAGSELYRARRVKDAATVLIKWVDPAGSNTARFKREYRLLRSMMVPGVARPIELIDERRNLAMVLEDFAGEPCDAAVARVPQIDWIVGATIARNLAQVLAGVHAAHVIHQDIRPANILVNPVDGRVCLSDFSLARTPEQKTLPTEHLVLVGDWPYISPEQTGRTNTPVDCRTDFYSLGVTLYQLLTGRLPFQADDPLEWVHCHIARTPLPVCFVADTIPGPVSDIVMRLLAKSPEDRYQSGRGLAFDLDRCLTQWQSSGQIDEFPLGGEDFSDQFRIPHRLYGRTTELARLLEVFERVAATSRPELIAVSGYSGIGKSSLVHELRKPILLRHGYFISGKFDQSPGEVPYAPLTQAFRDLTQQLLAENEGCIAQWRQEIQATVGINGQLIIDVLPQVELIIGPQPPVPALAPSEQQNRFRMVFQEFISVFGRKEHPLVLFLDDVQWIDAASLRLIEHLPSHPDTRYLLLIAAYRDNEVGSAHPLLASLSELRNSGVSVTGLPVLPLSAEHLDQLVAETLHAEPSSCQPLTHLIFQRTEGNPFFFIQFLTSLHQEGLLRHDAGSRAWTWDLEKIKVSDFADNVVQLMLGKLRRLPPETQKTLQLAACLGNKFDLAALTLASGVPEPQIEERLSAAVREDLIAYLDGGCKFLHDHIQQAAYALIPEDTRPAMHLEIGRALLMNATPEWIEDRIFEVVSQLDLGVSLIESQEERLRVARLNLKAGKRAKQSTAYAAALKYLATGEALLVQPPWEQQYRLAFELGFHRAECEYLTGALEVADERLSTLWRHSANVIDKAAVASLRIDVYTTLDRGDRAVEACLEYLFSIGIRWSAHPADEEVQSEFERIWNQLGDRSIEELVDLPPLSDPGLQATIEVLAAALAPALFTDPNLLCLIVGRMVNLSLEHGNGDASCVAYVLLGIVLGPRFGDYRRAYRFGKLAYDIAEKQGLGRFKARVDMCFGNLVSPWTQHLPAGRPLVRRAFDTASKMGDLTFASYCCNNLITNLLASGDPLGEVQIEAEHGLEFAHKARFGLVIDIITAQLQLIRQLRGLTPSFSSFNDAGFDEGQFERHLEDDPRLALPTCWYWIRKLQSRFFAGDYASAIEAAMKARRLLWTSPSFFETAEYCLFAALARAQLVDAAAPDERRGHWDALVAHHRQLQVWAENGPENFENRATLVAAEVARIEGRDLDAIRCYEQASRSAREHGFVQNEALANELAARFFLSRGFPTAAMGPLEEARAAYARWGADGKVRQLEECFPRLRAAVALLLAEQVRGAAQLDLLSVAKASQAISSKLVMNELIDTLMRITIESAGAQAGYLVLLRGDTLTLAAEACADEDTVEVRLHQGQALPEPVLPVSVINYVQHSRSQLLLADAAAPHPFATDPYFARRHPKSVLCLPILRQAALIGLLYLENNLFTHAFTPERVTVLALLASQVAISIDNAQLYADLRQENSERKRAEEAMKRLAHERESANRQALFYQQLALHRAQFDELTRLPNRAKLREDLRDLLADDARRHQRFALVTVGLDDFSAINSALGNKIGDSMLEETAARLTQHLPEPLLVARTGSDLFACVLQIEPGSATTLISHCERLQRSLAAPLELGEGATLSASLGIALFPDHADSAEQFLQCSDTALHQAKAKGRGRLQLFDAEMHQIASRRLELNKELHRALQDEQLALHYQPIVSLDTGELLGVEALARWRREDGHYVPPDQFVPVAEAGELLRPFTEWTIRTACRQMADWRRRQVPVPYVSFNLSAAQIRLSRIDDEIMRRMNEAGLTGNALAVEVTEGALLENLDAARVMLVGLRQQGLSVAVDDFGIGYASPHYLRVLPVNMLKIDGSFLKDVPENPDATSLLNGIIDMGRNLRLRMVMEVVETERQSAYLASRGVNAGQGFWFSRSLPAAELENWIRNRSPTVSVTA